MPRLVYDSTLGGSCPRCQKTLAKCRCAQILANNARPKTDGIVRIRREMKNGKPVTAIFDLPYNQTELQTLAARLKSACGSGGTAKDGIIEIQGDHRERIAELLRKDGHQVKFAGG